MKTLELRSKLRQNGFSGELAGLYGCAQGETPAHAKRFLEVMDRFEEAFGAVPETALFSSPGRTEIGGNHTDHQLGCVLAGSIDLDIIAAAAPGPEGVIRLKSGNQPLEIIDLAGKSPRPEERHTPRALVRGVAASLEETGRHVGGADICAASSVPTGSGLSSSAAFEMLIAIILNSLHCHGGIPPVELAKAGRRAENMFYGKPCGLMDQLASLTGGVVFIDFRDPEKPSMRRLELNLQAHGHAMCIIDSGADHAAMSAFYADITREMEAVAACFGKSRLREVERDGFLSSLAAVRKAAGDRASLRAWHFLNENRRAQEEEKAIREGRFAEFLALFNASGRSSWTYLQNVTPPGSSRNQEMALTLALCEELLAGEGGFRVHGGGFAGTAQAIVPLDRLEGFKAGIEAVIGMGRCRVVSLRGSGGVRLA